ncbi:MAG: nuclear transport factor 2 family protein [Chitinophagaceae bacterium]
MKKKVLLLALVISGTMSSFAQKKTNGTVYIEHPAIKVVDDFITATVSGDSLKLASYLTDDFRSYNGTSTALNDSGATKAAFIRSALRLNRELDYFVIENTPGAYSDAIEYKKDNKDDEVWVQTWNNVKGVHKVTGVKLDAGAHRLYRLNKDNKIKTIINYNNGRVFDEIGVSYSDRTNGRIYNHHDNINTVRKSMYAFEKGDLDKAMSYYADDAVFLDINSEYGKTESKAETRAGWQKFLNDFEVKSIDMIGYPDNLEYEMDNGRVVISWWKFNLVRKSDKKPIVLAFHISNDFDDKGMIESESVYYSEALLRK